MNRRNLNVEWVTSLSRIVVQNGKRQKKNENILISKLHHHFEYMTPNLISFFIRNMKAGDE